jgi:magnesium chelatase family protein
MPLLSATNSRYVGRISGPLLDRIEIHIDVPAVRFRDLAGDPPIDTEDSAAIRERVIKARAQQTQRFQSEGIFSNAAMTPRLIRRYCRIDADSEAMLERAMNRLGLSARAYDRILKVSRTIADLEGSDQIQSAHVSEAVHYRSLDRTYCGSVIHLMWSKTEACESENPVENGFCDFPSGLFSESEDRNCLSHSL